jgi:hypothetical protein
MSTGEVKGGNNTLVLKPLVDAELVPDVGALQH